MLKAPTTLLTTLLARPRRNIRGGLRSSRNQGLNPGNQSHGSGPALSNRGGHSSLLYPMVVLVRRLPAVTKAPLRVAGKPRVLGHGGRPMPSQVSSRCGHLV
jgi:hypothetical protein